MQSLSASSTFGTGQKPVAHQAHLGITKEHLKMHHKIGRAKKAGVWKIKITAEVAFYNQETYQVCISLFLWKKEKKEIFKYKYPGAFELELKILTLYERGGKSRGHDKKLMINFIVTNKIIKGPANI